MHDGAIKKIVGHKIQDITEATYTERDIEWLREDIEKIPIEKRALRCALSVYTFRYTLNIHIVYIYTIFNVFY